MPRSFLVKKNRSDHQVPYYLPPSPPETELDWAHRSTLKPITVQLNNGYIQTIGKEVELTPESSPQGKSCEDEPALSLTRKYSQSDDDDDEKVQQLREESDTIDDKVNSRTFIACDAFYITDGRSKKRTVTSETSENASKLDTRQRYTCSECGKNYATSSNLSRHKQTHRSYDSKLAKQCPHCEKVYVSMPALAMHILTHNLKHKCSVCNKAFSRPWLLQGHMRSHNGDKPFGCAHCGKAFADRSNLRAHMQTHSSFKNFKCKRCHKSFALKSYLNKHYESACLKSQ